MKHFIAALLFTSSITYALATTDTNSIEESNMPAYQQEKLIHKNFHPNFFTCLPNTNGTIFQKILSFLDPFEVNTVYLSSVSIYFYNEFLNAAKINFTSFEQFINAGDNRYIDTLKHLASKGNDNAIILLSKNNEITNTNKSEYMEILTEACLHNSIEAKNEYGKYFRNFDNKDKLLKLSTIENTLIRDLITEGFAYNSYGFSKDINKLLELANLGWKKAQNLVTEGYANGSNGFPKNQDKLLELANLGWEKAQILVTEGYAYGANGFPRNQNKLLELANLGWKYPQILITEGYVYRSNEFIQKPTEAAILISRLFYKNPKNSKLNYVFQFLDPTRKNIAHLLKRDIITSVEPRILHLPLNQAINFLIYESAITNIINSTNNK